jgi:hypothetical protein
MVAATELIRKQLRTVDEEKIKMFEADPCEMKGFYDGNALASQGEISSSVIPMSTVPRIIFSLDIVLHNNMYPGRTEYRGICTLPNQVCSCSLNRPE